MGALSSVVSGLDSIASTIGTVTSLANNINTLANNPQKQAQKALQQQQGLALGQLKQQQDLALQNDQAQSDLEKQQISAQAQSDADQRQVALRRAVARQRAAYGAQGISPDDGSSEAVLLGLYDNADQVAQDSTQTDNLRSAALDQNLTAQNATDLLQRSQLQQRQNLALQLQKSQLYT